MFFDYLVDQCCFVVYGLVVVVLFFLQFLLDIAVTASKISFVAAAFVGAGSAGTVLQEVSYGAANRYQ